MSTTTSKTPREQAHPCDHCDSPSEDACVNRNCRALLAPEPVEKLSARDRAEQESASLARMAAKSLKQYAQAVKERDAARIEAEQLRDVVDELLDIVRDYSPGHTCAIDRATELLYPECASKEVK